jgi:hypothetical protein
VGDTSSLAVEYSSVISSIASSAADFVLSHLLKLFTCDAALIWRVVAAKRGRDRVPNGLETGIGFERTMRAAARDSTARDNMMWMCIETVFW